MNTSSTIWQVAVPCPLPSTLDYLSPSAEAASVCQPGCRVWVPLGRRRVVGVVLAIVTESDCPAQKLRQACELIDAAPIFSAAQCAELQWMSRYYHMPIGQVFAEAMPKALRLGKPSTCPCDELIVLTVDGQSALQQQRVKGQRQLSLLTQLQAHTQGLTREACRALGVSSAVLRSCEERGWIACTQSERSPWQVGSIAEKGTLTLNEEQQAAVDAIQACESFNVMVLQGITGSGKTEVYFKAMQAVLQRGQTVLLLIPEISLTPQTLARITARFDVPVVSYHSRATDKARYAAWLQCYHQQAAIVVGTRSAIFLPAPCCGLIIIDESHDNAYKQQSGLRYNAQHMAIRRAQCLDIPIVLGSATPSLATLYNIERERYQVLSLTQQATGIARPDIEAIALDPATAVGGLSPALLQAIADCLQRSQQVLLFLNRRGFSPLYLCHHCRFICECPRCDVPLTFHQNKSHLRCHHCGWQQTPPRYCPQCKQANCIPAGVGTEQVEAVIKEQFPQARCLRIDRDTTRKVGSLQASLEQAAAHEADVLIGTQMLAKGHHFKSLALVAILNADQGFYCSDFTALEKTAQLIVQVAGRAGREVKGARVVLQSTLLEHPLLQLLLREGYDAFAQALLQERQQSGLPPQAAFAIVGVSSRHEASAQHCLQDLRTVCQQKHAHCQLLGPMPALLQKKAGQFRFQLGVLASDRQAIQQACVTIRQFLSGDDFKQLQYFLDIDPISLY